MTFNNIELEKNLKDFLDSYHTFEIKEGESSDTVLLTGMVNIITVAGEFLDSYQITISCSKKYYPYTIPIVTEKSQKIFRHWDNHISAKGECCLSIPHNLLMMKNRGIVLKKFYSDVIYPFFANYHYKKLSGEYANGEYAHFDEGIIQYYRESFSLVDPLHIKRILEAALGNHDFPSYHICPICGNRKYKKCCRKIIYKLLPLGKERLKEDLKIFNKRAKEIPPTIL